MKNIICLLTFSIFFITSLFAQTTNEKWGISACITPWIDNREFTISRSLSKSWTILIWGDFTFDKNKIPGNDVYDIDKGYKWLIGPEFRKKIYYSEVYKIAPYLGLLINGGYEKYDMTYRYYEKYKKSHYAFDGGLELTFGVEYFLKKYLSINIHTRFLRYHYYWIDLDIYHPNKIKYKTGYHVFKGFNTPPAVFIRFYF